jgi:hypothetical protein
VPLDLTSFALSEMLQCRVRVRHAARDATSMEDAAGRICRYLYSDLVTPSGERACRLVRAYKVHAYGGLPPDLQRFARRGLGESASVPDPAMRCLTLLATAGDEAAWNERHLSKGHQAIPMPSPRYVERAPMISQLFREFGVEAADVVSPAPGMVRKLEGKTYGVFFVENANGSPYIPAQTQFVERYGIQSVLGFGGSVTGADLFAVILFTGVGVRPDAADRFRTIALDVKGALIPFAAGPIFGTVPEQAR